MGATREPQVVETCPNGRRDAPAPGAPKTGYPLRGAKIKGRKSRPKGLGRRKKVDQKRLGRLFGRLFCQNSDFLRSNLCFKRTSKVSEVIFGKIRRKKSTRLRKVDQKKSTKKSTFDSLLWALGFVWGSKPQQIVGIMPLPLLTAACRVPVDSRGAGYQHSWHTSVD